MGHITQKLTPCYVTNELLFSFNNAMPFTDELNNINIKPQNLFNNDIEDN